MNHLPSSDQALRADRDTIAIAGSVTKGATRDWRNACLLLDTLIVWAKQTQPADRYHLSIEWDESHEYYGVCVRGYKHTPNSICAYTDFGFYCARNYPYVVEDMQGTPHITTIVQRL